MSYEALGRCMSSGSLQCIWKKSIFLCISLTYNLPLSNSTACLHANVSNERQQRIHDMLFVYNVPVKYNSDFTRKLWKLCTFLVVPIPVFLVSNFNKYYRVHLTVYKQDDVYVGQKTDAPILSQSGLRLRRSHLLVFQEFLCYDELITALVLFTGFVCPCVCLVTDTRIP